MVDLKVCCHCGGDKLRVRGASPELQVECQLCSAEGPRAETILKAQLNWNLRCGETAIENQFGESERQLSALASKLADAEKRLEERDAELAESQYIRGELIAAMQGAAVDRKMRELEQKLADVEAQIPARRALLRHFINGPFSAIRSALESDYQNNPERLGAKELLDACYDCCDVLRELEDKT